MAANLLPFLRDPGVLVARRGTSVISRAQFLADIEELAARLPDRPYSVNFCADRYRFSVAWAAAMLRRQITLLPNRRDSRAVAALLADYPALYVLTDDNETNGPVVGEHFTYPTLTGAGGGTAIPAFPPDQIAAILFTSGSTGQPHPSPRRWGRLHASTLAAGAALGIARHRGAALVATAPHAHSYGLESAIMLPLQHGLLLTTDRPFFPADIATALITPTTGQPPSVLVTTPVHLRTLVGDAATPDAGPGFGAPSRAGFVLSATAPLSADLAARAESAFSAPVFEIYGCSEAGQLATRRTVDGPVWRCLTGFRLTREAGGIWASGPGEDPVPLADEIELAGDGEFILQGRTADLVSVAGKRSSLAYLTRQLTAIDGVRDGVFLVPEDAASGTPNRLAALVVAPGLEAPAILAALRQTIDPAFLPRPLRIVDRLPRDALGKLARAEILRLVRSSSEVPAPAAAGTPSAVSIHFPADHPTASGHFPGNPIIPAAVLLDEIVRALFPGEWIGVIESAKFHHPVRPGETLSVNVTTEGSTTRFEARLAAAERVVLSGALRSTSPLH